MSSSTSAALEGLVPRAPRSARPAVRLRQVLTLSWVIVMVLFTLARLLVVRETLQDYGLNIWIFGVIDLATAIPYALGVARVAVALVDRDPTSTARWATVAVVSFLAPYAYVAWAGKDASFPPAVYVALVVLLAIFGTNAIWSVRRKVRDARTVEVVG